MKKPIIGVVCSAFLLGMTASAAYALHEEGAAETSPVVAKGAQVTLSGSVRARGYIQEDFTDGDSASDVTGYDSRARLGVQAKVNDAVTGFIHLETGDGSSDNYTWGDGTSAGLHTGGSKQADGNNDLALLESWLLYTSGNSGLKVGHMPLALGHKLFFDHTGSGDDAIVFFTNPSANTHIGLLTVKFEEGATSSSGDDVDGYVALLTQKAGAMSFGGNFTFLDQDVSGLRFWNLGLTADGKAGAVAWAADLEYQGGEVATDIDQSAMAAKVSATFDLGGAKVGGLVGYGSGDDGSDATENETFTNFLTDTIYDTTITGYRFTVPGQATKNTGLANMLLVQANVAANTKCPISGKDLALKARVSNMTLNEVAAGAEDDLGTEVEVFATWKVAPGLSYKIEAAYLAAGDAWGTDPENPYFLRNGIEMTF